MPGTSRSDATAKPKRKPRRTDVTRLPFRWAGVSLSKEGELYRAVVRQLRAHVGKPNHAQELLIGRIAWLQVHLATIDERAMRAGGLSPHATREYLAWGNSIAKMLARLGLDAAAAPRETVLQRLQREATTQQPSAPLPTALPRAPDAPGRPTPPRMLPRMHHPEAPGHGALND
jgi:hypothetical protein